MIDLLTNEIKGWEKSKKYPNLFILTANEGSKAFCAGGDIMSLYK